jgi:hypothetical protein
MTIHVPRSTRLGFAAVALVAWAGAARADNLDQMLAENARPVLEHLTDKGYATVGVLKFEVLRQGPTDPVPVAGGQLGDLMATRLENALILATPERAANPLGIIRGASRVAAEKDPNATYQTPEGRAKLFAHEYPLAWGKKTATADALLVGRVLFDAEMKKAAVSLRVFDRKEPAAPLKDVPLDGGLVAVTRQTLADANQPFVVTLKGVLDKTDNIDQEADLAAQPLIGGGPGKTSPPEVGKVPPTVPDKPATQWAQVDEVLDFKVYYADKEVARKPDGTYPAPGKDEGVYFTMKLKKNERVGVVLLVNGVNTADRDGTNKEITAQTKWVLDPGKNYWVRGYYDGKDVHTFKGADVATGLRKLSALAPADKLGLIELHLFRKVPDDVDGSAVAKAGDRVIREDIPPAATLADMKVAIRDSMRAAGAPTKRSLIIPGKTEKATADAAEFRGYLWAGAVTRYAEVPTDK